MNEFGFSKKRDPNTGLDKCAVWVLLGATIHVRNVDTIEINLMPVPISVLDCPENSTREGQKSTRSAKHLKCK